MGKRTLSDMRIKFKDGGVDYRDGRRTFLVEEPQYTLPYW